MILRSKLFYILIASMIISRCKDHTATVEAPLIESNKDTSATPVKVALCREGLFEYRIEANGIFRADKELKLYADQNGIVTYTIIKNGLYVEAGQTLVKYDTSELALKLDRAEITRYNSSKEYESQLLSYIKLMIDKTDEEKKAIEKKLYFSTGYALAEQELKEIKYNIQKSILKAPFSGKIANSQIIPSQTVRSGEELATLISSDLSLECLILESDLPMIHQGQAADVSFNSDPPSIKGTISMINPLVESSGMAKVYIHLMNRKIYSGMHGHAIIRVPAQKSLLVPKEAVVIRGNRSVVFTLEGNLAKWNYVEVGRNNGVEIEVLSGLKAEDRVIVSNNLQLAHEAVVKEK